MATTRVIGYVRVSTSIQSDNGSSLAVQESKLRAYCVALGYDLVSVEIDAGFSASTLNRPALQRALAAIAARKADALLICKLDRLTRNLTDLGTLVTKYFGKRAALISVEESINTTSASGKLVLNLLTSVSAWEREACGERTAAVKSYQKEQGRYVGGAVGFGYRREEAGARDDGKRLYRVVEDTAEQAVIAAVRALHAQGMAMRAIAATLNEQGMRGRTAAIGVGQVQRMLAA